MTDQDYIVPGVYRDDQEQEIEVVGRELDGRYTCWYNHSEVWTILLSGRTIRQLYPKRVVVLAKAGA